MGNGSHFKIRSCTSNKESRRHVFPPPSVNSSIMQVAHSPRYPEQLQIWVKSNSGLQSCGWRFCITGINCLAPVKHSPREDLPLCLNPNYLFLVSHTILISFLQKASLQLITTYRRTKFSSHQCFSGGTDCCNIQCKLEIWISCLFWIIQKQQPSFQATVHLPLHCGFINEYTHSTDTKKFTSGPLQILRLVIPRDPDEGCPAPPKATSVQKSP